MLDDLVTLASRFFEACSVKNDNVAVPVRDEPRLLKRSGDERNCCAVHSEHLGEELLGQRKRGRHNPVLRLQQPSGQPSLRAVNGVACGNLLRFDPKHLRVARDDVFDGIALTDSAFEHISRNMRNRACYLDDGSRERASFSQSSMQSNRPLASYRCGLYARSVPRDDQERNHARLREVDTVDGLPNLLDNSPLFECRGAKARFNKRKSLRGNGREQPVLQMSVGVHLCHQIFPPKGKIRCLGVDGDCEPVEATCRQAKADGGANLLNRTLKPAREPATNGLSCSSRVRAGSALRIEPTRESLSEARRITR
jgi:hypothetical protein